MYIDTSECDEDCWNSRELVRQLMACSIEMLVESFIISQESVIMKIFTNIPTLHAMRYVTNPLEIQQSSSYSLVSIYIYSYIGA